jgi:hypothetical protein
LNVFVEFDGVVRWQGDDAKGVECYKQSYNIIIPIFFTRNFGRKRLILDRYKKNLLVIWTSRFEPVHYDWAMYFLTKLKLAFFISTFD